MFVNGILNDNNYKIISDELKSIKNVYRRFIKENLDFKKYVCLGLKDLVRNRVLTNISSDLGSSYYVGLNSSGLGLYFKTEDYQSRIEVETFLSVLKSMCTDGIVSYLNQNIKKRNKQIRFLNVVKALREYECKEVEVKMDDEISIINPKDDELRLSNYRERRLIVMKLRIEDGELYSAADKIIFNDSKINISKFLILEQLLDEVTELEEKYTNQMRDRITYNKSVKYELQNDLSGYFAAKSI